jgi:hypothetical protein
MSDNILLLTEDDNYLTAENGDYLIAVVQYLFTAQNGSYEVAGQTATLLKSKVLYVLNGSYAISGQSINVTYGHVLIALNGDYSVVGNNASITYVANPEQKYIDLRSFTERRRI